MILRVRNLFYYDGAFRLDAFDLWVRRKEESLTDGPLTLSLRYKKRRRLVNGRLEIVPHSNRHHGLSYEYLFYPHDKAKLVALLL